ncbi:MAG TPA: HAMP domain-containing sensor histidine kinase [Thermoanaerobaculaceae bacterium]|nr:HAMP domain-containing sensor histidine kinase [Thermoanaerobaculaceae bacterium]
MRGRLYRRIFLFLLLFVSAALALSALASHLLLSEIVRTHLGSALVAHALHLGAKLPAAGRPDAEQQAALERLARLRGVHASLWSADGRRVAFTDIDLPAPRAGSPRDQWLPSPSGPALLVALPDGRRLVLQPHRLPRPGRFLIAVLAVAALLALASYPAARFVTRRLETLETGVRRLGAGDLGARVEVEGNDELASLASSFNQTAQRLQALVEGQRRMLASASHELRSPLTRLRMGLELAREEGGDRRARIAEAVAEVEELDALVEELLVAGRLELEQPAVEESVDVGELLASEAARTGATIAPLSLQFRGDPRLLRVMLRNLLENARRHGLGSPVEAGVERRPGTPAGLLVWVADRGPGVPESERERIFEPFYRPPHHAEGRDGGVGLGLYLVRRIARLYGGTAACLAREGGGSRFEVTLFEPPA